MAGRPILPCQVCGYGELKEDEDGYFYCNGCGYKDEDIVLAGIAEEDHFDGGKGGIYSKSFTISQPKVAIKAEPVSQYQSQQSEFWGYSGSLGKDDDDKTREVDTKGPSSPNDFGSKPESSTLKYENYQSEIRVRYVMGIQAMIQLQCKALVEKFGVSPLIVGLVGPIWFRYVAVKRVLADDWADLAIHESESQSQGEVDASQPKAKFRAEPFNILGKRSVIIWYKSLCRTIPLSCSLVISFLACHLAREAILPTDIVKWAVEGKLPYFAAFSEIEKQIGPPTAACPLSSKFMFRPVRAFALLVLEPLAASVAQMIGLELPPVNFSAIASRYIRQLSLPVEKILPHACRIFEWSMPPELWLSTNYYRFPTRVSVMSILIVAIRILYNINGFGKWEMSLSSSCGSTSPSDQTGEKGPVCNDDLDDRGSDSQGNSIDMQQAESDVLNLLRHLEAKYDDLKDSYEYSKGLHAYLEYCKNVAFAGLEPSFKNHEADKSREEEKLVAELWEIYQNRELGSLNEDQSGEPRDSLKRTRDDIECGCNEPKKAEHARCFAKDQNYSKDIAIRKLKMDMEENMFFYMPPRCRTKKHKEYFRYIRKLDDSSYCYAVHAEYYIILRACARLAQVDLRVMHWAVLCFEKRLNWIERRIDQCMSVKIPDDTCEHCCDAEDDNIGPVN